MKRPIARRETSASDAPPAPKARLASTTTGRRITSLLPLSSRRARRAGGGSAGLRTRVRRRTGSVEASAAPRIAAPAGGRPSRSQAARAMSAAGRIVPGPRMSSASRRCSRTSPMSTEMASLNSTSTRASVARTSSDSDSSENSTTPRPAGPSMAPRRRKIATWGTPDRSTAPDSSEAAMMTTPMSASAATKGSWNMVLIMAAHWRSPPAAW